MLKTKSLRAYYRYEVDAFDHSDNGNTGFIAGAVIATGLQGNAFSFDGINDRIQSPTDSSLTVTNAGTLCAWVNTDTMVGAGGRGIISKRLNDSTTGITYSLMVGGSTRIVSMNISNGSTSVGLSTVAVVKFQDWSFIAVTWLNGVIRLYIDGFELATSAGNPNAQVSAHTLNIGSRTSGGEGSNFFNGLIDEPMIYATRLESTDIRRVMMGLHPLE